MDRQGNNKGGAKSISQAFFFQPFLAHGKCKLVSPNVEWHSSARIMNATRCCVAFWSISRRFTRWVGFQRRRSARKPSHLKFKTNNAASTTHNLPPRLSGSAKSFSFFPFSHFPCPDACQIVSSWKCFIPAASVCNVRCDLISWEVCAWVGFDSASGCGCGSGCGSVLALCH